MTDKQRWLLALLAAYGNETEILMKKDRVYMTTEGNVYLGCEMLKEDVEVTEDGYYEPHRFDNVPKERIRFTIHPMINKLDSIVREQARDVYYHLLREVGDQLIGRPVSQ